MRSSFISLFLFALVCTGCGSGSEPLQPPKPPPPSAEAPPSSADTKTAQATNPVPVAQPVNASSPRTLRQHIADASAESRVIQALLGHDELRVFDFDATVQRGALVLAGDVNTVRQRRLISRVIRRIQGVSSVSNRVTVAGQPFDIAIAEAKQDGASAKEDDRNVYYTVRSGDTLWNIARRHSASVQQIKTMNRINGASLQPGQRIRVR